MANVRKHEKNCSTMTAKSFLICAATMLCYTNAVPAAAVHYLTTALAHLPLSSAIRGYLCSFMRSITAIMAANAPNPYVYAHDA